MRDDVFEEGHFKRYLTPIITNALDTRVDPQSRPAQLVAMPLIYGFVARGQTVLAEHTLHSGNFATVAAEVRPAVVGLPFCLGRANMHTAVLFTTRFKSWLSLGCCGPSRLAPL